VPLTSTVESVSRLPLYPGRIAEAALEVATVKALPEKARPHFAMPPKNTARFPRTARLLRHADFERVYKQGRRHFSASMTVFYWQRPEAAALDVQTLEARKPGVGTGKGARLIPGLRVGFTVGRVLGGAVQRNRMKRRLREAVRMTLPADAISADVVINPKKSLLAADFAAVRNEVSRAFAVIEQKLSGKTDSEAATNRRAEARSPKPEARQSGGRA
jgi:ribonuclease P protein component